MGRAGTRAMYCAVAVTLSFSAAAEEPADAGELSDDELLLELAENGELIEVSTRSREAIVRDSRAVTLISSSELAEMVPRSTPEALMAVPGVSVQKTNHAGGSPYVRGTTGQQTLLMLDGFRLQSAIARSGPNQYLNTVDPGVLDSIEVLRGAGSVLYGSDAIGGVVSLRTKDPRGSGSRMSGLIRGATADRSLMGRAELDTDVGSARVLGGFAGATFGDLRGGGPVEGATVPQYDGDRQRFTGYDQYSGDLKVVVPVSTGEVTAAGFSYRQLDAPRTDRCSNPPLECRYFDEQYYDIGYLRYRGETSALKEINLGAAVSRTHEQRERFREERNQRRLETDQLIGVQVTGRTSLPTYPIGNSSRLRMSMGFDASIESLSSEARAGAFDSTRAMLEPALRAKYIDGSRYGAAAAFVLAEATWGERLSTMAGVRLASFRADVADDPSGGTPAFDQSFWLPVGSLGVRLQVIDGASLVANVDQGFRAPNLDDLTAQSSEGPGFQIGNSDLGAETSVTLETGVVVERGGLDVGGYVYVTYVDDYIGRVRATCPARLASSCGDSENVFRLANSDSAEIFGTEVAAAYAFDFLSDWQARVFANATWTRATRRTAMGEVPLSKIPPLAGRAGVRVGGPMIFGTVLSRWAAGQDRLSEADIADPRIPDGGTAGYVVFDLRAGARISEQLLATLTLENLANTSYRVHGSGVDGAGFGAILGLRGTMMAP